MKIKNIIAPLTLIASTALPLCSITNCGGNNEDEPEVEPAIKETALEYIYNRSFSLLGYDSSLSEPTGVGLLGTCWILSDATPNDSTDFKYYIATNWHVQKGAEYYWEVQQKKNVAFAFGCTEATDGSVVSDYVKFTTYEKADDVKSTFDGKTKTTISEGSTTKTGLQGCDLHVALADFSSCLTSTTNTGTLTLKKLKTLNKFTEAGQNITRIAPTTTDSKHYEDKDLYTAGYPSKYHNPGPIWEYHRLNDENKSVSGTAKVKLTYKEKSTRKHDCDNYAEPLIDCSPQYAYIGNDTFVNWMNGGASGSMLIGDFGTSESHNWKVIGIYWGGWGNDDEEAQVCYIKPYYSIFNSNWKNYVSEWIK